MLSGPFSFGGHWLGLSRLGRPAFKLTVIALAALCVVFQGYLAGAQQFAPGTAVASGKGGVWYQVKASIKPLAVQRPADIDANNKDKSEPRASMTLQLRISSHAEGSRFFGYPSQQFDFKLTEGSEEKLYWQDTACHPNRGLPRISIVALDGQVEQNGKTIEIKARPRKIGTKLPADELSAPPSFVRMMIGNRPAMVLQSKASSSRFEAQIALYAVDCAL